MPQCWLSTPVGLDAPSTHVRRERPPRGVSWPLQEKESAQRQASALQRQELQQHLDSETTVDACLCTMVDILDEDVEGLADVVRRFVAETCVVPLTHAVCWMWIIMLVGPDRLDRPVEQCWTVEHLISPSSGNIQLHGWAMFNFRSRIIPEARMDLQKAWQTVQCKDCTNKSINHPLIRSID